MIRGQQLERVGGQSGPSVIQSRGPWGWVCDTYGGHAGNSLCQHGPTHNPLRPCRRLCLDLSARKFYHVFTFVVLLYRMTFIFSVISPPQHHHCQFIVFLGAPLQLVGPWANCFHCVSVGQPFHLCIHPYVCRIL